MRKNISVLTSPDDWWVKAGAYIDENSRLHLPYDFLLVTMAMAAEAVVAYRNNKGFSERIKNALIISNCVRSADIAYYTNVVRIFKGNVDRNSGSIQICHNCIRGKLWPNRMQELRSGVNSKIIHVMEKDMAPDSKDLDLAVEYYQEMFTHNLIGPTLSWGSAEMPLCQVHAKKLMNRQN